MIGYKGFNADWTCLGFQYKVGKTYEMPEKDVELCESGFHFCLFPVDVLKYYPPPKAVYAEVRADGLVIEGECKCVTNKITIIRALSKDELMDLMPPVIRRKNRKEWYSNGDLHRLDEPAVEWDDGDTIWYQGGQMHREGGPAMDYANYKGWFQHGLRHRVDGPANEWTTGLKEWYLEGRPHRTDGPAIEYSDGRKEWWIHGIRQDSLDSKENKISS